VYLVDFGMAFTVTCPLHYLVVQRSARHSAVVAGGLRAFPSGHKTIAHGQAAFDQCGGDDRVNWS
jgi:hypothetical protein